MTGETTSPIERYYRWQAPIYDATRWSFLFGRRELVDALKQLATPARVLEVGCGTGAVLGRLAMAFPGASLVGLDTSAHMLAIARRRTRRWAHRIELHQRKYDAPSPRARTYDVIVFSYALSMFNPGWAAALACASEELAEGGLIAVADFHDSPLPAFRRWMRKNHVEMDGHLLPALNDRFEPLNCRVRRPYLGLWSRFNFIGRPRQAL